ncbi:MAG: SDR family oxidoreductase [Dehalococcoidia bacterium]|nr:SDR family oxidoreductase [Dehalococcoidia bacterium]
MSEVRFDGRVAIVTGAGGGLGRAHALLLASRGAKVVVNDLGGARDGTGAGSAMADQVVADIRAAGGEAAPDYHGVNTAEGGEAIVQTALDAYGKVDILINNAGILRDRAFHNLTEEDWEKVLAVHLKGAFCVTQPAFRVMRQNQYGRIVFTTSAAGLYGNFGQTNYGAAKMALVGMMNTLKIEGQKYNIRANTIAPLAASRLTEDIFPAAMHDKLKPEFVSPVVAYLCSEECAESGSVFTAAGGYFGRAAMVESKGVFFDNAAGVSIEDIRDSIAKIKDISGADEFPNANAEGMSRVFTRLQGAPAPSSGSGQAQ